jgi:hypothetical protein
MALLAYSRRWLKEVSLMSKPLISIKKLLSVDADKVEEIVAEIESAQAAASWTGRLVPSTKGGKSGA